jgi:RNA polymerase sigma factor (sigma-70 family)
VKDCIEGDESAWAELIRNYQRLIYSVARTLCPESEDAADVFQQVCLELYQRLPQLRDVQTLPKWLITVTRRKCLDLLRKKPRSTTELQEDQSSCEAHIEDLPRRRDLERALEQLPERYKGLLVQLYFSERPSSYAEIGERLGIPVSSIGPMRARGLQKLRALMESR